MRVLSLSIDRFSANADNVVYLAANWQVERPDSGATQIGTSGYQRIEVPASSDAPGDIAAAMSRAVGRLAVQIAARLKRPGDDA